METNPIVPKQEHIDMLMNNPTTAELFDEVYGDGASLKYLPVTKAEPKDNKEEKDTVSGIIPNVAIGVKEYGKETLSSIQGVTDYLKDKFPALKYTIRSTKDGIEIISPDQIEKEEAEGIDPFKEERAEGHKIYDKGLFEELSQAIPESGEPEGVAAGLSRNITKFVSGFITGGKLLNTLGWTRKTSAGLNVARSFVQGGFADFTAFDEHEARLADLVLDKFPHINSDFLEYMAADENDTFMEGKFKNVLEGLMLGGAVELLFRTAKLIKGTRKRVDAGDLKETKKYVEKEAKEIDELQTKAEKEIDEVAEQAKGSRGLPDKKPKPKFDIKSLKETDFFKNVQTTIKKIRTGEADIDDLEELTTSIKFLDNVDEAAKVIRALSDEINKVTKEFDEVQGHDQVWRQVDNMMDEPTEALIKAQQLAKETDKASSIILAQRVVLNGLWKNFQKVDHAFSIGKATQKELDEATDILQAVYRLDRQIGKNTGRALEIRKVIAQGESKASKKISKVMDEAEIRPEEGRIEIQKKLRKVKNKKGFLAVMKAAQEKFGLNGINKFWINALLSNPKTHMINMTSNTAMALIRPIEQFIGGVLTGDKSSRIEAIQTAAALIRYMQESLIMARESFKKSDSILDKNNFKVDLHQGAFKKGAGKFEKGVEMPTRFLSAEDEFFKQLNYRAKVYGQAFAEAVRKNISRAKIHRTADGRKYSDFDKYVENRFDEAFLPDKSANPSFKNALEYAQENTFTKGLGQNTLGKTVQSAVNQVPILRQIMPFVRTPVNIMRAVWERSPLGIFRKQFREELKSADKTIRASAVGKQAMGAAIFTSAIVLAWNGMITGGVPKDKAKRRQKFDTGWRPYSFKLGDTYYSYERLDPFGMFFGLVADYATIANEITEDERAELGEANLLALMKHMDFDDYAELGAGGIISTAKNISSKTYLKSLTDFISALSSGDPREWKRYGLTKTGSFVPNIIKGIINDPIYREVRTLTDTLKTRTGIYGDTVDASYNALGEERTKGQGFWDSFLFPITQSDVVEDNVVQEFDRLDTNFTAVDELLGNNKNIDLTQFTKGDKNAWVRWNELMSDSNLRADLEKLISSDRYKNKLVDNPISDEGTYQGSKQAAIKRIINKYKKKAKIKLLKEGYLSENNLDLRESIRNDKKNKVRALRDRELLPIE